MRRPTPSKSTASTAKSVGARKTRAKTVIERPGSTGWRTNDSDEIALRRWRGTTEIIAVTALEPEQPFHGTFRAKSTSGADYEVEIRDLNGLTNSCGCIDHRVNGLGACKHIEGVLAALRRRGVRTLRAAARTGPGRAEVFLDRRGAPTPTISWPGTAIDPAITAARDWLGPWLRADGTLTTDPAGIETLLTAWAEAQDEVRAGLRVSRHFGPWLERVRAQRTRAEARTAFEADLATGAATLDILNYPLLPYQRLGTLHLAFGERTLLADEMGLGKTIQAIAACELLARRKSVERVLIVCPASLKAEWEEQIARFCGRATQVVFGGRAQRLAAYAEPSFFTIVNYEQVLGDAPDINRILRPDIVVLDEAQRIKNWQTKTARSVKALRSPYAFVLTGTPVENRIDELYSIIQYLDPEVLGPLFRFNRDFYQLDERGRPMDYKNLAELRERLAPLMLRRRKADVESELPGRTLKTFFTPMAPEQKLRYDDYQAPAARLIAQARRRPLLKAEFDRLQQLLACMRMVCDTPAILDPTCRVCPKLEELEGILEDLLEDPTRKVIIFSEWERMLVMVRELAGEMGVDVAWHTGSVAQERRRAEINRFKHDPACRLFLSTDSGSVGLNLQVASAVINVDLPWNPAKLEQRIARAWRKNQMRSVSVINLVTQGSIEHSIMHLLGQKQALADGVLDGTGDLSALKMPSGRGAFIERMETMVAEAARLAPRVLSPEEAFVADLTERLGERVIHIEARPGRDGRPNLLAVVDLDAHGLAAERARCAASDDLTIEVLDKDGWRALRRLADTGMLRFTHEARTLHRSAAHGEDPAQDRAAAASANQAMAQADRALGMARLLAGGGFGAEALDALGKATRHVAAAVLATRGEGDADDASVSEAEIRRLADAGALSAEVLDILDAAQAGEDDTGRIERALASANRVLTEARRNEPRLMAA